MHLVAREQGRLADLAGRIGATYSVADVEDGASIAKAVEDAASVGGGVLKGLCYAVGCSTLKPLARLSEADFERDFRINALGAVKAVQAALPALKKAEGAASRALSLHGRSCAGVHGPCLRRNGQGRDRGTDAGAGGGTRTQGAGELHRALPDPHAARRDADGEQSMANAIGQLHAMQRLGEGADIAPLAALLLSDDASHGSPGKSSASTEGGPLADEGLSLSALPSMCC